MPTEENYRPESEPVVAVESSPSTRRMRILWVSLWSVMLFAPSIMLGFTATESKFSAAAVIAAAYLLWRILFRPLPPMNGICGLALLFCLYLLLHGMALTLWTGNILILLLEGQWICYFLAGFLLTMELGRTRSDLEWASRTLVRLGVVAAALGLVSIWTGPFYSYANHYIGRWGLPIARACGTFESPGMLAGLLAITFALLFFTPRATGSATRRRVALTLMAVTLLLTQAKGGIVACLLAVILGIPVVAKTAKSWRAVAGAIVCAVLLGSAIGYIADTYLIDPTALIENDVEDRGGIAVEHLSAYFTDDLAPQLFGLGYRQTATIDPETGMWFTAHNSYISLLREIGLVGCLLLGAFLLSSLFGLGSHAFLNWTMAMVALLLLAYTEGYLFSSYVVFFLGCGGAVADRLRRLSTAPAGVAGLCAELL